MYSHISPLLSHNDETRFYRIFANYSFRRNRARPPGGLPFRRSLSSQRAVTRVYPRQKIVRDLCDTRAEDTPRTDLIFIKRGTYATPGAGAATRDLKTGRRAAQISFT